MSRRLPPLNALRAFEAVARYLSVSRAADELNVTPAAVSHQIRTLEDHIGQPLFRRTSRNLLLTDAGQACLPGIRDAFERLAAAMAEIDQLGTSGILTVSAAPSFAVKWLLPRLDGFNAAYPDIDLRISASMQLTDFARDQVDMAIRYGSGRYPDLTVEKLLPESVFPVCSPKLLDADPAVDQADWLGRQTLLHDDSPDDDLSCPNWTMWLKARGVAGVDAGRGPRFNQSSLVLEAAALGRGVALAKATLATADLAEGRLVRPFGTTQQLDFAYFLVFPNAKARLRKVLAFRDWLMAEAAQVCGVADAAPVMAAAVA